MTFETAVVATTTKVRKAVTENTLSVWTGHGAGGVTTKQA
jgi:hypothetical protein